MSLTRAGLQAVNRLLLSLTSGRPRPAFYEISEICPELDKITAAFPAIRQEALALANEREQMPSYDSLDTAQSRLAGSTPKKWSVFFLNVFGFKPKKNRSRCPQTCAAIEGTPNMLQAFF